MLCFHGQTESPAAIKEVARSLVVLPFPVFDRPREAAASPPRKYGKDRLSLVEKVSNSSSTQLEGILRKNLAASGHPAELLPTISSPGRIVMGSFVADRLKGFCSS